MRLFRLVCIIFVALLPGGCDPSATRLTIVTPVESVDRSIVEDLDGILARNSALQARLTEQALSESDALDAVASGRADLALVSNYLPFRDDIATVMPLYPTVLHIGTSRDVDDALEMDIPAGAVIYAGPEGSASRIVFGHIADRLDLAPGDYQFAAFDDVMPDLVIEFAPISPDTIEAIHRLRARHPGLQLVSMGSPEDLGTGNRVDAAVLLNPHFRPFVIPRGTYGDFTAGPVVTVAVDKMLVTRPDLDQALVYDLISELVRLRPALAANRPGLFRRLSGDFDASRSTWVVHAGTQAYLDRDEPSVYERYSGIAEVLVTAFVALASASIAGLRIYRMRRKNRIDKFYARVIDIRRQAVATADARERERLASELKALQDSAFAQLIDEKLAADESFRIFITLSNDVLAEMREAPS